MGRQPYICRSLLFYFSNDCREERKRFETIIFRKLNELLEIAHNSNSIELPKRNNYSLLPPMPFDNINALKKFDLDLKNNEQMRNQFVSIRVFLNCVNILFI